MAASILVVTSLLLILGFIVMTGRAADGLRMPPEERRRFTTRATQMLLAWVAYVAIIGATGALAEYLPVFIVSVLVSSVIFARSPIGRLLETLPFSILVGFQGFRVLAELALYFEWKRGLIPVDLTFEGHNFDIVTGIAALILWPMLRKRSLKPLIWVWSVAGIVLLLTIVSMHRTAVTPVTHFPYILLPGVLVWSALTGHFIVFQKLLARD